MGVSDHFHFSWLNEAIEPVRETVRCSFPERPQVLGLGEQAANPFVNNLLEGKPFNYQAADLFPLSSAVIACDINDLSPLTGNIQANVICFFRSSYFIKDKQAFLHQIKQVLAPNGYLFMDFLIGSSDLPVLDFRYGKVHAAFSLDKARTAYFGTSFYDDRLIREFPEEASRFCRHARRWPLTTQVNYLRKAPGAFVRDVRALKTLTKQNLGKQIHALLPEKNVFSLSDFDIAGFDIVVFHARYFYPLVKKYNLYCFVGARLRSTDHV